MHYLIDGYNFLFWQKDLMPHWGGSCLRTDRENLIQKLINRMDRGSFSCRLIFDAHHTPEGLTLLRQTPLDIVFTPKGLTADEYILECLCATHLKKGYCVVTHDKGLQRKVIAENVPVIDFVTFFSILDKKKSPKNQNHATPTISSKWVQKYTEIFEKRFNDLFKQEN